MKKIILFSSLLFGFYMAQAQGDLQFNRVINYELQPTTSPDSVVQLITVANDKVVKIENIIPLVNSNNEVVRVDGARVFANFNYFPFWLSSGNHTITYRCAHSVCPTTKVIVSAIEFNIIP